MMINTHGLKMNGLRTASGKTYDTPEGLYVEIFYNKDTGEVWAVEQQSGSWGRYKYEGIVRVCGTNRHMTMQEIADEIPDALFLGEELKYRLDG